MRKLAIALVIMWSALAMAQQQWTIPPENVVSLWGQTALISQTPLFTPTNQTLYRVTFYFSAIGNSATGNFLATITGEDITGIPFNSSLLATCGYPRAESTTLVMSLNGAIPFSYQVTSTGSPTCAYNLTIAVEQLSN